MLLRDTFLSLVIVGEHDAVREHLIIVVHTSVIQQVRIVGLYT